MIEQIFIHSLRDGSFSSQYIGARSIHDVSYKKAESNGQSLVEFEALLMRHGFMLVDSNEEFRLRVWSRVDDGQLALGASE